MRWAVCTQPRCHFYPNATKCLSIYVEGFGLNIQFRSKKLRFNIQLRQGSTYSYSPSHVTKNSLLFIYYQTDIDQVNILYIKHVLLSMLRKLLKLMSKCTKYNCFLIGLHMSSKIFRYISKNNQALHIPFLIQL